MKRDIKFRGLDEKGNWQYGHYHYSCLYPNAFMENYITNGTSDWVVDKKTISQFTGLTDKNGKEIYEGDIVQGGKTKGEITFENGCFMWQGEPLCYELTTDYDCDGARAILELADTKVWAEVIGNIYTTPELL